MNQAELSQQVAELYRKYGALVERRCQAILGHPEAARDAVQEVFVRVLTKLQDFREEASPVSWLYRISTNICIDHLRSRSRKNHNCSLTPEMMEVLADSTPSAENLLDSREQLRQMVLSLSPEMLQIMTHAYMDHMTQDEIAQTMGLSRKTVWSKLQQLRQTKQGAI